MSLLNADNPRKQPSMWQVLLRSTLEERWKTHPIAPAERKRLLKILALPEVEFYAREHRREVARLQKQIAAAKGAADYLLDQTIKAKSPRRSGSEEGLTAADVATSLTISYDSALRLIKRAGAFKVGNLVRIKPEHLTAYLEEQRCLGQEKDHTLSNGETRGTRTSIATSGASRSTPPTRRKRSSGSPNLSKYSASDLRQDLRGKKH